eukprot:scaffold4723_cov172-Amphora_coffeaeformis.AAC.6
MQKSRFKTPRKRAGGSRWAWLMGRLALLAAKSNEKDVDWADPSSTVRFCNNEKATLVKNVLVDGCCLVCSKSMLLFTLVSMRERACCREKTVRVWSVRWCRALLGLPAFAAGWQKPRVRSFTTVLLTDSGFDMTYGLT